MDFISKLKRYKWPMTLTTPPPPTPILFLQVEEFHCLFNNQLIINMRKCSPPNQWQHFHDQGKSTNLSRAKTTYYYILAIKRTPKINLFLLPHLFIYSLTPICQAQNKDKGKKNSSNK